MADNKFLLYELIKNNDKFNPNTEDFQDKQLITRAAFEDMLDTDNYSWSGEKYQQNQFIYEYEIDNIETTENPDINDYIEIVGGTVQTKTYNNSEQSCEFKIKMKGDTVLHKDEDYIISSSDSFDVTSDTDPTSPYYETITMYGTDAETYYVTIEGIGDYQDSSITLKFIINKKSLSEATITQNNELVFSGGINDELNPEFKIQFDNDWYFIVATNTTSNNFDVTFNKTTGHGYAGEHTNEITIKAKNNSNYTGSVQVSYFVNSATPSISFVKNNTQVYDEFTPRYFKVNNSTVAGYLYYKIFDIETSHEIDITDESTYDGKPYINTGDDISVSNAYRINIGTYYIVATFVPNNSSSSFSDTPSYETVTGLEGTLTIKNEGDLLIVFTSDTNNYVYNDEPKTPNFRVECNGVTISSDNYTYSYDNNTNAGTATLTVTGKNNYNGKTANATFTIKKATPTLIVNDVNTEFDFNMHYLSVVPSVDGILKFNRINSSSNNIYTQGCTANNTQYLSQIQEFNNTVETYGGSLRINLEFTPNNTNYNTITTEGSINITPRDINQTVSIWLYDDNWDEYTGATYVYDGNEKQPNVKIYISDIGNNGKTIELRSGSMTVTPATQDRGIIYRSNGVSYEVIYENNINANNNSTDPSVTVDISGNMYANPITTTFVINKADLNLDIGFGITYDDVSNDLLADYDSNKAYTTFYTVYDDDGYAIKGTIHYEITTEEIEHATPDPDILTNSSSYTETGKNPNYIWIDGGNTEYTDAGEYYLYAYFEPTSDNYNNTSVKSANLTIEQAESDLQISEIGDGKYDGTGSHLIQFTTKLSGTTINLPGIIEYGVGVENGVKNYDNSIEINATTWPYQAMACVIQYVSESPKTINIRFKPTNKNYTTIETTYDLTLEPRELDGTMFDYQLNGNQSTFTYDGTKKMPGVTVKVKSSTGASSSTIVTEDNYTIQYGENINAGNNAGSVTIIGKNNLSGSFTLNFTINKKTPSAPNIITGQKYFSYDNTHNPANKTFNVTNNNNVAGTIIWSLNANYKYIDNSTYNTTYTKDNISIDANETLSVEFDYTVGTYEITAKFVPNDSSNYNESNSITATGLEVLPDVTDIWISDTPASSFDTGTAETGNFVITQGSFIQLYVVGRESGWYGHDTDVDSRYVDISVASILETTDAGANYVNLTSGYELEGIAVGGTNGTPSDADYENYALHAEYINHNNDTKSHASNVTVTSNVVGLAAYIKNDNDIYATPTSSSESDTKTVIMRGTQEGEPDAQGNVPYTHLEIMPESFDVVVYEILQTSNGEYELGEDVTSETRHNGSTSGGCTSNHFTCSYKNTNGAWTFSNFDTINYEGSTREDYSFNIQYGNLSVTFTITFTLTV